MKADYVKVLEVFFGGGSVHYLLPHFQREYAWTEVNWSLLLEDSFAIHEEFKGNNEIEHFFGSLVVVEEGMNSLVPVLKLVDGQQRLTTIALLLCAIREYVRLTDNDLVSQINSFLLNGKSGDLNYKILPTAKYGDRDAYKEILETGKTTNKLSKIPTAFEYIQKELKLKFDKNELEPRNFFEVVVTAFQVVFIKLSKTESPYKIFESLNAKNKQLTQADLVRNYIAMRLSGDKQEKVFNDYWSKIEDLLHETRQVGQSRIGELTGFLRHYLALYSGNLCNEEHIYARFRDRMQHDFADETKFIEELKNLYRLAQFYDRFLRPQNDPKFSWNLKRLSVMEYSTSFPFLLKVYSEMEEGKLTDQQVKEILQTLENYMVRRFIAGEPTNYLNKMFPVLWKDLDTNDPVASLRQSLANKNYPGDQVVRQKVLERKLYSTSTLERISLILKSIEYNLWSGTGGYASLNGKGTIEHIMPQTIHTSPEWQVELGPDWQQTHDRYLHTLGNLTLVTQEWNSTLSNRIFAGDHPFTAQDGNDGKKKLYSNHALRLNSHYFSSVKKWDEAAIRARADFLSDRIVTIWPVLGTPSQKGVTFGIPITLAIGNDSFSVASWRDVTYRTVLYFIDKGYFDNLKKASPLAFEQLNQEKIKKGTWRDLKNGWIVYVDLSAKSHCSLCKKLVVAAGLPVDDWTVTMKDGSTTKLTQLS